MENGPGGIHISLKWEQCLLLIHGEHIVPGDDAGGGDGGFFQAAPLPQLSHKRPSALRNSLRPFGLTSLVNEGGFSFLPLKILTKIKRL